MTKKQKETENHDMEEFYEFLKEFKGESDRAAVILGAAKLDLLLYRLLTKALLPNTSNRDDLFDGDAPLSTSSAKINLAYRLGLIDSNFTFVLHMIRKIRNSFAHEVTGCKLSSGPHRDRIKELIAPLENYENFNEWKNLFFKNQIGPSVEFRSALALLELRLEGAIHYYKHVIQPMPNTLIPPGWIQKKDSTKGKSSKTSDKSLSKDKEKITE